MAQDTTDIPRREALRRLAAGAALAGLGGYMPRPALAARSSQPIVPKGTLMVVGGGIPEISCRDLQNGGDRVTAEECDPSGLMRRMIALAKEANPGKKTGPVVECITCASACDMQTGGLQHRLLLGRLGASEVNFVDVGRDLTEAEADNPQTHAAWVAKVREAYQDPKVLERLGKADLVLMPGGDQENLADILNGTEALEIIRQRYFSEAKFVLAGNSAGAMFMSENMIAGPPKKPHEPPPIRRGAGVTRMIVETHMGKRTQERRLLGAVDVTPASLGVGLDNNTALIIRRGAAEVMGAGRALVAAEPRRMLPMDGYSPILLSSLPECAHLDEKRFVIHSLRHGDRFALGSSAFVQPADNAVAAELLTR